MFMPESPKHRIEFTGNSAPKKRRKPPAKWMVGWPGGLLLFIAGAILGGALAGALIWPHSTDDMGSFSGAMAFALLALLGPLAAASMGGIAGLLIWAILRVKARDLEVFDD